MTEKLFAETYPALHRHFKSHESKLDPRGEKYVGLRHREDQGRWWWELRSCAYYDAFARPKTLYVDIAWTPSLLVDLEGRYTNNTCYFIPSERPSIPITLNSPVSWWYAWRKAQHGKDEALRYFTDFIGDFPVASFDAQQEDAAASLMQEVSQLTRSVHGAQISIADWLRTQMGVDKAKPALSSAISMNSDAFAAAVRSSLPRSRGLTAADVAELKREHAVTIAPAQLMRAEIFSIERKLADLVNSAYGLTSEDVQLMWRTAPPRMPFTPTGLLDIDAISASGEVENDA